jgi:PAS domain S-box-containing protein
MSEINFYLDAGKNLSKIFFETLLNAIHQAVICLNAEGLVLHLNSCARTLYGHLAEGSEYSLNYREIDEEGWANFQKVMETGEPLLGLRVEKMGREYIAHWIPAMEHGQASAVVCTLIDVQECEKNSHIFSQYEKIAMQLDAIMEASYDGICITDDTSTILKTNSAFGRITGFDVSEMVGFNARDLVKRGFFNESVSWKVLEEKKRVTITQKYHKTGKEGLVTGNPIYDSTGKIVMVVTNIRDMTDLQELNQRLEDSLVMTRDYEKKLREFQNSGRNKNLIMASPAMQAVDEMVERVSSTDATVLIWGETGVGKEKIAEEIHARSDRAGKSIFVKINCGAIPETLLESELFGYEKGAFTGALQRGKIGLFELADKGTLFLDEVGSIPLILQSKLLRVLQNFEITRLGGTLPKKVNVRLICASNQELRELIAKQQFRSDLYYRLNVIPLFVPALRDRREDIPHLINLFLDHFNTKYGKNKIISKRASDSLLKYPWPGNVRELENLIERLVVIVPSDGIQIEDLPAEFQADSKQSSFQSNVSLPEHLKRIEKSIIQNAIKIHGNARKAAFHLGVNPSTVTRKLKRNDA